MKALPLWISVPVTVAVSLPFGLWLGSWSLPLWLAFIVWAEYFTLGAKPSALKTMVPAFLCGVVGATVALVVSLLVGKVMDHPTLVETGDVQWFIGLFIGFIPVIYAMKFLPFTDGPGGLPFFNGISMGLATFFVGGYVSYGDLTIPQDDVLLPLITSVPAVLGGLLGAFLGWFNVAIMAPIATAGDAAETTAAH
ncbi:DUF1097 domain-containing protein [Streptomyces sp. NPDC060065]|uniref:DUF1097 domain-containing protein n=1 Tax=Streptomyces sp. NPDC060065 TaxID=3347050 RepID=UPI0036ACF78A